jgi:hypothetical protein
MSRRALSRVSLQATTSILAIVVALSVGNSVAQAQIAKEESVLHRVGGKDYAPDGIQLGSFIVSPRVEVGAEYDDNVFRTKHGRKDDIRVHVSPAISIATDGWDTVNFSLGASADVGRYVKYSGENYEAFQTNANLTYALDDDWSWGLSGTAGRSLARRGLDIDNTSSKATTYWFYTGQTDLIYQGDPFAFRFSPVYRRYDFKDSGGVNNDDRDRHEYELGGRFAYKVGANTSVFFDPSYIWVRYDTPIDDFGHNRNSEGYDLRVGFGYDASETLYLEAGVGYFHRTFQDHAFKPASGISALAKLYWNPTDTVSLEAMVSRGVSESDAFNTTTVNSGTAVTTGAELRVGWLAADNVLFDTGVGWYNFDYNVLSRKDNFYLFDAGVRYYLNRNLYTGLRYYFERRRSDDSTLDYNDNRVMIMIGGQL